MSGWSVCSFSATLSHSDIRGRRENSAFNSPTIIFIIVITHLCSIPDRIGSRRNATHTHLIPFQRPTLASRFWFGSDSLYTQTIFISPFDSWASDRRIDLSPPSTTPLECTRLYSEHLRSSSVSTPPSSNTELLVRLTFTSTDRGGFEIADICSPSAAKLNSLQDTDRTASFGTPLSNKAVSLSSSLRPPWPSRATSKSWCDVVQ